MWNEINILGFFYWSEKNEDLLYVVGLFIKIVFKVIIKILFILKVGFFLFICIFKWNNGFGFCMYFLFII